MKVIMTGRLMLRNFKTGDWKSVCDYTFDSEVVRYVDFGSNSEEESRIFARYRT